MIKMLIKEKSISNDVLVFNFRITNVWSTNLNVQETNVQEASIFGKNIIFLHNLFFFLGVFVRPIIFHSYGDVTINGLQLKPDAERLSAELTLLVICVI